MKKGERFMKRKMAFVLAVICLVLNISTVSYAAEKNDASNTNATESGVQPYYLNTSNIAAGLRIEGNTAYCLAEVIAKKVCSVDVIMILQRKEGGSWVNKISWASSSKSGVNNMSNSYTLFERGSYRVKVYATVGGEKVTCTSATKTY